MPRSHKLPNLDSMVDAEAALYPVPSLYPTQCHIVLDTVKELDIELLSLARCHDAADFVGLFV